MTDRRDDRLRSLLPSKDAAYDFFSLTQAETDALEEAFSDGFGAVSVQGTQSLPLPRGLKSGLLKHAFYTKNAPEDDYEDPEDAFWERDSFDDLAPSDKLPINFIPRRLRIYFKDQLDRFYHKMIREDPGYARWDRECIEELALGEFYAKPWYEFHALQLFQTMDELLQSGAKFEKGAAPGFAFLVSCFAGELGRLSEQYYWRFRFEGAAITGIGARKGASAGGVSKAALHQTEHCAWQKAASEIWERRSELSKIAVAGIIRKQSRLPRTAKHIARYISRPQARREGA